MKTSKQGLDIIKKHEGLRLKAYQDIVGVWTIGYGHTKNVSPGQTISQSQADNLLKQDVSWAEEAVNKYLGNTNLTQNQFDALVSLVFNVGAPAIFTRKYNNGYTQGSSLYNKLLQGNIAAAAKHFTDFSKAGGKFIKGLFNRRVSEKLLFLEKKKYCSQCGHLLE